MNCNVTIDWKFVAVLGGTVVGIVFAVKMNPAAVERVSTAAVGACKEYAIACNSNRIFFQ